MTNVIVEENKLPGTPEWQLTRPMSKRIGIGASFIGLSVLLMATGCGQGGTKNDGGVADKASTASSDRHPFQYGCVRWHRHQYRIAQCG